MQLPNVEDFYPLSPLQQGLLFHSLADPESGLYFNQTLLTLHGELDVDAFRAAWQRVVDRHPILRTFFVWEGVAKPVQVVKRDAAMPFDVQDWRGVSEAERGERFDALRRADLERGFDLSQAPLMRAALLKRSDGSHDLFWTFHHILLDGWSMFRVLGEVFGEYDAAQNGVAFHPSASRPYRDHIVWLNRQSMPRAEAYWRRALAGFAAPTPLPEDAPAGADADFASVEERLSAETTAALEALCKEHRLTLNTLLQGSWALLLSLYSGEQDVLFGGIVSGRPAELDGVEAMVGLFINTLPIRVRAPGSRRLLDWLRELQAEQAEMRQFEYSPLLDVQGWSEVPRGTQLFDSIFMFENYKKDAPLEALSRTLTIGDVHWFERHNFPLAAVVVPDVELELRLVYRTERFSDAAARRMLGHWCALLAGMAGRPDARLDELELLTPEERERILASWNDTAADVPDACVHVLFEAQVDQRPEAVAVVRGDRKLTYGELDERANRLAHRLRKLGIGPGELVAIWTERTPEMIVGMLATLKAGGAYVPLDPGLPARRLAFVLGDADVRVVLTRAELEGTLPEHDAETVVLDPGWKSIATESAERPEPAATPRDLAYVIYTSGSTGEPKGVELEHAGLVNLLTWHQRAYDVEPDDRATHLAGLGFDASVWEMWPYLAAGASLHLVGDEERLDPKKLLAYFAEHRITQAFVPTPMAEALLREDVPADLPLRVMQTGGDKLNRAPERALPFRLVNHYGPTECTVVATATEVPPDPDDDAAPPIGGPIQNTRAHLLDRALRPVPVGVPGELYLGGRSLARGYRNRPAMTAEKFVPDPFGGPGERLYATGDLARWRDDGRLDFLGRMDDQVKIRGYRIELGEIEVTLGKHSDVREAVVLARKDSAGESHLVAYVVGRPATAELRRFLQERLPDYMVPAAYVTLDAFPLNASGKVDRRALPAPETVRPALATDYAAPAAEIEHAIAGIWQDVLNLERVGVHDNFFDLGGHSLHLLRVHSALKSDLGRDVPMVAMFQFPTVSTLAKHLGGKDAEPEPAEATADRRAGKERLQRLQRRRKRTP